MDRNQDARDSRLFDSDLSACINRVKPILGDIPLQGLSRQDYRGCFRKLQENGLGDETVKTTRKVVGAGLRHALAEDYMSRDLTLDPVKRKKKAKLKRIKGLSVEQAQRFVEATRSLSAHDRACTLLFLLAGLRTGEVLALRPDHLQKGAIHVENSASREDGIKDTKSGEDRKVPLAPDLAASLKRLDLSGPFVLWPEDERDRRGVQRMQQRVKTLVRKVAKMCGVTVTPHGLRHTFASILIATGENLYAVSRWCGHADIDFTVRIYGSWLPPEDTEAIDRFASRLTALPSTVPKPEEASLDPGGTSDPHGALSTT